MPLFMRASFDHFFSSYFCQTTANVLTNTSLKLYSISLDLNHWNKTYSILTPNSPINLYRIFVKLIYIVRKCQKQCENALHSFSIIADNFIQSTVVEHGQSFILLTSKAQSNTCLTARSQRNCYTV